MSTTDFFITGSVCQGLDLDTLDRNVRSTLQTLASAGCLVIGYSGRRPAVEVRGNVVRVSLDRGPEELLPALLDEVVRRASA